MDNRHERKPVPALRAIAGMLANPGATFAAFPEKQPWFVPLLLFCLISAVPAGLVAPELADLAGQQVADTAQQAGLPAREIDNLVRLGRSAALVGGIVAGFLAPVLEALGTAVVVWILLLVLRNRLSFGRLFSVATYAYVPHVFATVLVTALVASGMYDMVAMQGVLPTSLRAMFPGAIAGFTGAGFLSELLKRIELFTLWSTVLLGIGLSAATDRTARWGIGVALAAWLLIALAGSALSALGSAGGHWPTGAGGIPGLGGGIR